MKTISTHQAKTHLSRYLVDVEQGQHFVIARGKKPVAMLVPLESQKAKPRPKVGEIEGPVFEFPLSAFAPLDEAELHSWGL